MNLCIVVSVFKFTVYEWHLFFITTEFKTKKNWSMFNSILIFVQLKQGPSFITLCNKLNNISIT